MILFWSSVTASLVAIAGCSYLVAAAILVGRSARNPAPPRAGSSPAVTMLKPLHGDEPGLVENLDSFCRQDYSGPIQVVFGVQDPNDGAIAVVQHLQKAHTTSELDLVIETKMHGLIARSPTSSTWRRASVMTWSSSPTAICASAPIISRASSPRSNSPASAP